MPMSQQISSPPKASSPPAPNCIETAVNTQRELSWQVASNLFVSFKYAWCGISYAFQTQRNFRIHVGVGALAISLSVFYILSLWK